MKRFWSRVGVIDDPRGHAIALDGRPVRTPGRAALYLATRILADSVAAEWREVGDTIDPGAMPLTGLANAALDLVEPDPAAFAAPLARYAASDLLCYRADDPALADEQAEYWETLLDWARARYDVHFVTASGIMPVDQPPETIARLGHALAALPAFRLAAMAPLVTISGSLVVALALEAGAVSREQGWDAVTIDERWQERRWGEDAEAKAARDARHRDWNAAATFLRLLDDDAA